MKKFCLNLICLYLCILGIENLSLAAPNSITFWTGPKSGIYYSLGKAIQEVLVANNDTMNITTESTNGSGANISLILENPLSIAFSENVIVDHAYNGIEPFEEKMEEVRAIARIYTEYLHIMSSRGSGINTIRDFKGKRISLGPYKSGSEASSRHIFADYGIKYDDFEPLYLNHKEVLDQLNAGTIDAFVFTLAIENDIIQNIISEESARFIMMDGALSSRFVVNFPAFTKEIIPAGTYDGLNRSIQTLAVQALLIVNNNMSEESVYAITKSIFENSEEISKVHGKKIVFSLEEALDGITIPIHDGAKRYYIEMGLIEN